MGVLIILKQQTLALLFESEGDGLLLDITKCCRRWYPPDKDEDAFLELQLVEQLDQ